MKAVILCAAKEENLFPFSESKPTCLMPVMGKPIIEHSIDALKQKGVEEFYLVTNHLEDEIEQHFSNEDGVELVHQEELDGTASALETCSFIDDDILVINGDVIISENDIHNLLKKFRNTGETSILATDEDSPEKFGVLSIQNDEVSDIEEKPEKPENPLINTGVYAFKNSIFDRLNQLDEEENSLTDAVNLEIQENGARFELIQDYWIDIGSGEKLWKADQIKRQKHIQETKISEDAEISEKSTIEGKAKIEAGAEIKPGTVIEGKAFIGQNTVIGPNTVIKDSSITRESQLDQCSVEETLLFENNILDAYTVIENSVLGEETDVKPGTVIRESLIGARSFIEINNSIRGTKFVPDARTDLSEISK